MNLDGFIAKIKNIFHFSVSSETSGLRNDQKMVLNLRENGNKRPKLNQLKHIFKVLSYIEKKIIFSLALAIFFCLGFIGIIFLNDHIITVPANTGEYIEGVIGSPRFLNPLFAQDNEVDYDLTKLIFPGLLKYDKNLKLTPDLAESYEINDGQTLYTFHLRKDVVWQKNNGVFTADDVIFTIDTIKNNEYKSSLYGALKSIEATKIDDYALTLKLKSPYAPFLNILTFGILPQTIWINIPSQNAALAEYNLKPVGAGMYEFSSLSKDKIGNLKSYTLTRNEGYYGQKPYIKKLTFKFYPDAESAYLALKSKEIQGVNFLPKHLRSELETNKNFNIESLQLPQYTAIFFNQEQNPILKDIKIRQALAMGIDKNNILTEALSNEGIAINGPILPGFIGYNPDLEKYEHNPQEANKLLDDSGWTKINSDELIKNKKTELEKAKKEKEDALEKLNGAQENENNDSEKEKLQGEIDSISQQENSLSEYAEQTFYREKNNNLLSLNFTTVNTENNFKVAESIKNYWKDLGVFATLNVVEPKDISDIIKARNYDCLLYGEIIGADPDPYPFWHSSQNQYPGLNLAIFSDKDVDKLLEEARQISDPQIRKDKYVHFQNILIKELPAIFLYSPTYSYILNKKVQGFDITNIYLTRDRFANIEDWYIKTRYAWK